MQRRGLFFWFGASIMKVEIKSVRAVAVWKWDAKSDAECSICQSPLEACCPECTKPGEDCAPVWGRCNHIFHMHCIWHWLKKRADHPQCPNCRSEWEFRQA
mmetsp:Transcript_22540/g.44621  ORF Transcript_22540/g.44621 Transcript_22540/m.44621 type:complete len:101 (+) Transcript_22540:324-626(+)